MTNSKLPLVSIMSLAYNHEAYFEKAIESWLMQKVNFDFEIVIAEDHSTDRTREIVFSYAEKYPDIIRVITSESNVGMKKNAQRAMLACRGKYLALCEGDDYWIDPLKLQKQTDFMEANPDFSICFHDALLLWDDKSKPPAYFVPKDLKEVTSTEDVIENYYIPTASMLLRTDLNMDLPDWFKHVYNGDWGLQLILSTKGKIKYFDEIMSVYRKNAGGLSGGIGKNAEFVNGKKIELLTYFNDFTEGKYADRINKKIAALEQNTKSFNLRKKSKLLFWLKDPKKTLSKFFRHISGQ
jgi:glycosyltransferase involved in cell wall biosynthesis